MRRDLFFGCILLIGIFLLSRVYAQSDLFRLRTALISPLIDVQGEIEGRFEIRYLLDNASCVLMVVDKGKDTIAVTQVNKASCNHLR